MSIVDRIKAHQSAPDVYDPPTLDVLMNIALAAQGLMDFAELISGTYHGGGEVMTLTADDAECMDAALAAFRAACGEGE